MKKTTSLALLLTPLLLSAIAQAHVSFVDAKPMQTGKSFKATFAIPHGCEGATTQKVTVQIPEGVINVKAMPKANWSLQQQSGNYAKSYTLWGKTVNKGVTSIVWQGALPDDQYDEFTFTGYLSEADGKTVYFPVTQSCAKSQLLWTDTSGHASHGHDAKELAAPFLMVQ